MKGRTKEMHPANRKKSFSFISTIVLSSVLLVLLCSAATVSSAAGKGLTMDFREADIRSVLRIIAQEKGLNIIAGQEVQGSVTVHFKDVSLIEALDAILTVNGFTYEQTGNIIKVLPIERFQQMTDLTEVQEKNKTKIFPLQYADATAAAVTLNNVFDTTGKIVADTRSNSIIVVGPSTLYNEIGSLIKSIDRQISVEDKIIAEQSKTEVISRIYTFNHASAEDMKTLISDMVGQESTESRIMVDNRTNSLILIAPPSIIGLVEQYIEQLDVKAKQVMIEAKLVEVTLTDNETLGIEWQWSENGTTATKTPSSLEVPTGPTTSSTDYVQDPKTGRYIYDVARTDTSASTTTTTTGTTGTAVTNYYNSDKNLSTVNKMGVDSSLGMTLAGLMKFGRLSAVDFITTLKVLKARGNTKLVSAPKVTTLNNQEAHIVVREQEPYLSAQQSTQNTQTVATTVEYKDIPIELTVTPQINENDVITMKVHAIVEEKTGESKSITGTGNEPIISGREAETSVLVRDGDTIVIGGLVKNRIIKSHSKLPILGDIPLLGKLFRKDSVDDRNTELLIFITPRIIDDSYLLDERDVNQFINQRMGRTVFPEAPTHPAAAMGRPAPVSVPAGSMQGTVSVPAAPVYNPPPATTVNALPRNSGYIYTGDSQQAPLRSIETQMMLEELRNKVD